MINKEKTNHPNEFNQNVFIVWRPRYNLGIPIIDEHHRGIVSTINSLYFGMQNKHGDEILRPIIDMVHDYTRIHFEVEEGILRKLKYQYLKEHIKLHSELIQELNRVGRKSMMDHNPREFLDFLKEWWVDHICQRDTEFLDFLLDS